MVEVTVVQYPGLPKPNWYPMATLNDGRTWHGLPWLTRTAAEYHARALRTSPPGSFMWRR